MFGIDFYPTPFEVISQMILPSDVYGKKFLEPSAGKGNIVDYLTQYGAESVSVCEIDPNLRAILSTKDCNIISDDFLSVTGDMVSHIDYIVMNPPFSGSNTHILHAWDIAPEGCTIISLCNYASYTEYLRAREVNNIIKDYGVITSLGNCFDDAERKTGVEIGLIKLYKPVLSQDFDYNGFFLDEENIDLSATGGLMPRNEIKLLVEHYVRALRCFDQLHAVGEDIKGFMSALGVYSPDVNVQFSYSDRATTKEDFAKKLQKHCWNRVFELTKIERFITNGVKSDMNKFVETQEKIPFTVKNISVMLDILLASRENIMQKSIEKAVDNFTKYTHENRFGVEGWKTNSSYMLNKKFIIDGVVEVGYSGRFETRYYSHGVENLEDLIKAICYIRGYDKRYLYKSKEEYDKDGQNQRDYTLSDYLRDNECRSNTWYDFGLFEFKVFKKGTAHLKFKKDEDWEALNRAYAKIKGQVLPEKL